jgi:hypothetical protein
MRRLICLGVVVVVLLGLTSEVQCQDMTSTEKKRIRAKLDDYFDSGWKDESLLNEASKIAGDLDSRRKNSKKKSVLTDVAGLQGIVQAGQGYAANRIRGLKRIEWKGSPLPGKALVFHLSVGKKYRQNTPCPVILALHAKGMNAKSYVSEAFLKNKGFADRYIIVAPEWPDKTADTWGTDTDAGLGSLLGALLYVGQHYLVDHDRVFVVGQVEGGQAAVDLAMNFGDLFAGVFPLGATVDEDHVLAGNLEALNVNEMDATGSAVNVAAHDRMLTTIEEDDGLRRETFPKSVDWRFTKGLQQQRAWWVFVETARDMMPSEDDDDEEVKVGHITAEIKDGNLIEVTTECVDSFRLCLNDLMVDLDQPVNVVINGVEQEPWQAERSLKTAIDWMYVTADFRLAFVAMKSFVVPVEAEEKDGEDEKDEEEDDAADK